MAKQLTIISVYNKSDHEPVRFWSGTGLSVDRAQSYPSREHAFCEWNEHSESFPGWVATITMVEVATPTGPVDPHAAPYQSQSKKTK